MRNKRTLVMKKCICGRTMLVDGKTLYCEDCRKIKQREWKRVSAQKRRAKNKKKYNKVRIGEGLPIGLDLDGIWREIDEEILNTHGDISRTYDKYR